MNDACSLFLVAAVGVQTGAVADGKTGIFPLSKPIQAMPGQKCGCEGWCEEHRRGYRSVASDLRSSEEQWAEPQPCLKHGGTRLTLSRVMCGIYCIPGSC